MWLSVLIVVLFGLGAVITLFGGGPIGFFALAAAFVGVAGKLVGAYLGQGPSGSDHLERGERLHRGEPTGYAHEGQKPVHP